jgi:hypothetical protein
MAEQTKERAITATQKKAMLKDAETRFRESINKLSARKLEMGKQDLMFKYDIGKLASTMAAEQGKEFHERTYGTHVVDDVAKLLHEEITTVYAAIKFANAFKTSEVKQLAEKWPWRGVKALLRVEDPDDRAKFQHDWEKGKYKNSDAFINAVAKYKEGQKPPQPSNPPKPPTLVRPIKTTTTVLTKVNGEVFPELINRLKAFAEANEEVDEKAEERAAELRQQLPLVKQMVVDLEKAMKAVGL